MRIRDDRKGLNDHLPPQNLEAERAVLGASLLDNAALHDVVSVLSPEDFYREAYACVYRAIRDLYDSGQPVDGVSLADELSRRGQYKAIGGDDLLMEIANSVPHAANAGYHAGIVRQKAVSRRLIQAATEIIRDGYANLHTAQDLLDAAEKKIYAIAEAEATGQTTTLANAVQLAGITVFGRGHGQANGLRSGFKDLDRLLDGFKPGDLAILAARPSQGKTAMATSIAVNVAAKFHASVLFYSLEQGQQQLAERLLSSESGVSGDSLRRAWLMTTTERDQLSQAIERLEGLDIKIDDAPARTVSQIGAGARRIKARGKLDLVVIDYLALIDGQRQRGENRQEEVARISRRLKAMARELAIPVLCLAQLNRENERGQAKPRRPRLSDLRESGQIEADADVVMFLHRPEYYDPNDSPGIAELIVAKNRNGPTGAIKLAFVKQCTRFDSLDEYVPVNGTAY